MMLKHKIEKRIRRLEKCVMLESELTVMDFFNKYAQLIDGTSKGLQCDHEKSYATVSEEIDTLFIDYQEQAQEFDIC